MSKSLTQIATNLMPTSIPTADYYYEIAEQEQPGKVACFRELTVSVYSSATKEMVVQFYFWQDLQYADTTFMTSKNDKVGEALVTEMLKGKVLYDLLSASMELDTPIQMWMRLVTELDVDHTTCKGVRFECLAFPDSGTPKSQGIGWVEAPAIWEAISKEPTMYAKRMTLAFKKEIAKLAN